MRELLSGIVVLKDKKTITEVSMGEFLTVIFSFPTIIFTVLLGVVMLYWLSVIIGFMDIDMLDGGLDFPGDVDIDLDADVDVDADADGHGSSFGSFLVWLGIADIPITIVVSMVVLWSWFLLLIISGFVLDYFKYSIIIYIPFALLAIFVGFIASLFLTKFCLWPILPFFANSNKSLGNRDIVGSLCRVESGYVNEKYGQARYTGGGTDLMLNVRNYSGSDIRKGQTVLITGYDKKTQTYRVDPYEQDSELTDLASRK